ncbi:S8 family serine peptidase [Actinomycetes bacterium KLBMP 9797]
MPRRLAAGVLAGVVLLATAGSVVTAHAEARPEAVAAGRTVTLVTGDQVTVHDGDPARIRIRPGEGREHVRFQAIRAAGRMRVVPSDAAPLLANGSLDPRLFDVATLLEHGYDRMADLPLIVTYNDGAPALRSRGAGTKLPGENTFAVRAQKRDATAFWDEVRTADGVRKLWLDGMREPDLATSVPRIGAPAAWQAGYTGAGVTVAVLDSGVDSGHPDLAGRVAASRNFVAEYEEDGDLMGHGTHVASTIAGSGAASDGQNRGVAPDARLVSGKVCISYGCLESWILAGMEWAAAEQGARVVNLSISGPDGPGVDVLEQGVAELTARYDVLFVTSAGNDGEHGDGTVGSPASAPAAVAVGAVDDGGRLAGFSSRGPTVGDAAAKPDLTAPGVDITAARAAGTGEGAYATHSGTSMAAPHVAGVAALLRQQHPDWSAERVKATLMASAVRADGVGVLGQGAGRVDAARAIEQRVAATPPSLAFGLQSWPHDDDQPVTREVTYHNSGTSQVELTLAVEGGGGLFALADNRLTVPAGGTARTTVTADTRPAAPGTYAGYLTATGGASAVHTPLSAGVEQERYDVTLVHTGRDGAPSAEHYPFVFRTDGETTEFFIPASGQLRLPRGEYLVGTDIVGAGGEQTQLVWPRLALTADRTVALDARLGKPLSVTVPDPAATSILAEMVAQIPTGDGLGISMLRYADSFAGWHSAQLGPDTTLDGMVTRIGSQWARSDGLTAYRLAWFEAGRLPTGFTRQVRQAELATVRARYGQSTPDASGQLAAYARNDRDPIGGYLADVEFPLPATRTEHYTVQDGVVWENNFGETVGGTLTNQLWGNGRYRAGRTYQETWNRGVLGPAFSGIVPPDREPEEVARRGDTINVNVPLHADSPQRFSWANLTKASLALYRDGTLVGELPAFRGAFTVPADEAGYRLRVEVGRGAPIDLATKTTVEWTFRSGHGTAALPVAVVRFAPALDDHNAAPAGTVAQVPVCVQRQPGSGFGGVRALTVEVSYDSGTTWRAASVVRAGDCGVATLRYPNRSGYVSLRAAVTDTAGNTTTQTILHTHRLR